MGTVFACNAHRSCIGAGHTGLSLASFPPVEGEVVWILGVVAYDTRSLGEGPHHSKPYRLARVDGFKYLVGHKLPSTDPVVFGLQSNGDSAAKLRWSLVFTLRGYSIPVEEAGDDLWGGSLAQVHDIEGERGHS